MPECPEIGLDPRSRHRFDWANEGPGQHDLSGSDLIALGCQTLGQPDDRGGRVVQHSGAQPRLFDNAVSRHDRACPAQIDCVR